MSEKYFTEHETMNSSSENAKKSGSIMPSLT